MLESFLKALSGEKPDEVVWATDITYWIDAQSQLTNIFTKRNTEEGYLRFCQELGTMPYYWYGPEGCWFGDDMCLSAAEYEAEVTFSSQLLGDEQVTVIDTPVGQLEQRLSFSSQTCSAAFTKYFVQNEEDLKVFLYVLEKRKLVPSKNVKSYGKRVELWKRYGGIPAVSLPRSPLSSLFCEWIGLEHGVFLLLDYPDLIREILDVLEKQEEPIVDAVCELAPAVLHFTDNLTSETYTGLFDDYMAPLYRRWLGRLHSANVKAVVHLDGTVSGLLPKLADVGFDGIEALTPKPVGDLEVERMRDTACSDKVALWGGVPGALFSPLYAWDAMEEHVLHVLESWKDQPFVLGVADQVPPDGDIERVKKISDLITTAN